MKGCNRALIVLMDTAELSADSLCWMTSERREWFAGRYLSCNWDMEEFMAKKDEIVKGDMLKFRMVGF
jgi:hypothetical protein